MPHVYVVNEPLARGGTPAIDVSPAAKFGELRFVFPPGPAPLNSDYVQGVVWDRLASFTPEDYLLAVGRPELIAAAAAFAAARTGGALRLLVWDRRVNRYLPTYLKLYSLERVRAVRLTEDLENAR